MSRAPSICSVPGCPNRAVRSGRCEQHYQARPDNRGTRTEQGYDNRWLRLVKQAIKEQPYCSFCFATNDLTGDHIIPKSKGGTATIENIRVLCRRCNSTRGNHTT